MKDAEAQKILEITRKQLYELNGQSRQIKDRMQNTKDEKIINECAKRLADIDEQTDIVLKDQRFAEDKLKIEQKFINTLARYIEKSKVPIISRDTKKADIRIGSRLYEFKVRHSKGELDVIKLEQLKKIHPDILEPTNKIRWNHMFESVRSYCRSNQTHSIQPSKDKRKEKLRWWLSNQIKLINTYFKKHDNSLLKTTINDSRHDEMNRRNSLLIENGLKSDLSTGRFRRPLNIPTEDSETNKRRLIRNINHQVKMLKETYNIDYISIVKERIDKQMIERQEDLRSLMDTMRIAKYIDDNESSVDKSSDEDIPF